MKRTVMNGFIIGSIVFLGLYLRLREFSFPILPDQRIDFTVAQEMIQRRQLPLIGIASSVPRFHQGPSNILFVMSAIWLFGESYDSLVLLSMIVFGVTAWVLFDSIRKTNGMWIATFATILYAISPLSIRYDRSPFYLHLIPLFFLLLVRHLLFAKRTIRGWFFGGVLYGLLLMTEIAHIPLFILLPIVWMSSFRKKSMLGYFLGVGLGIFPWVLYDLSHFCFQTCGLAVWAIYRMVAPLGMFSEHAQSILTPFLSLQKIIGMYAEFFPFPFFISTMLVIFSMYSVAVQRRTLLGRPLWIAMLFVILGTLVHGYPSEAYLVPLTVILPFGFVLCTVDIWKFIFQRIRCRKMLVQPKVSVVILAHRDDELLQKAIASVAWADEIVMIYYTSAVFQSKKGVRFVTYADSYRNRFHAIRELGMQKASNDWVLFLDSDEEFCGIVELFHCPAQYAFRRHDFLFNQVLKHGETANLWFPRLMKKTQGTWKNAVHEVWNSKLPIIHLRSAYLLHHPHASISMFFQKLNRYTSIDAMEREKGSHIMLWLQLLTFPVGKFLWNYIILRGIFDGYRGLCMAYMMSLSSLIVRIKQWETHDS